MKFSIALIAFVATAVSAVDPNQVPQFGIQAGVNPQNGNCDGLNGIKIPCSCPPDRNAFIAKLNQNVAAGQVFGTPVPFPTDASNASQAARIEAAIITLQNLRGPGVGCPASSTTFVSQRAALL